jgi:NAD(P)-dependent dehydrogenase (short-subunit alcohol dehydrogenase family)
MLISLEGKVALVTGVSHDGQIGQAVAKTLAEYGAALAICARSQSNVEARAAELRQAGASVFAMATSLTDESQVRQLIDATLKEYNKLDILVNLAGGLTLSFPKIPSAGALATRLSLLCGK